MSFISTLKKKRKDAEKQRAQWDETIAALDLLISKEESAGEKNSAEKSSASAEGASPAAFKLEHPSAVVSQVEATRKAISALPSKFTKSDVFAKVKHLYPSLAYTERDAAVHVWRLANEKKELDTETTGRGGQPSVYKKRTAA